MDCKRVEAELVAFQLAALDGPTRAGVEAHLVACSRCVGELLAIKRAVDAGDDVAEGPSELARARILRAAGQELTRLLAPSLQPATARPGDGAPGNDAAAQPANGANGSVERRRTPRLVMAAALLALGALLPMAWRAAHAPASAPSSPGFAPPEPALVTPERVDTARMTPENLRFL